MKLFKDEDNVVYAYELDGSQDHFINGKTPISEEEAEQINANKAAAAYDALTYAEKRYAEYPSIGDQLDALWKGGEFAVQMAKQVADVKAKYPKE